TGDSDITLANLIGDTMRSMDTPYMIPGIPVKVPGIPMKIPALPPPIMPYTGAVSAKSPCRYTSGYTRTKITQSPNNSWLCVPYECILL
ncbi:MAG: hypothetical protein LBB80_07515, partial [Treponema sp.]|nr:hypothetical protein [Treponema sp.]